MSQNSPAVTLDRCTGTEHGPGSRTQEPPGQHDSDGCSRQQRVGHGPKPSASQRDVMVLQHGLTIVQTGQMGGRERPTDYSVRFTGNGSRLVA
jgi:hypothetical protein